MVCFVLFFCEFQVSATACHTWWEGGIWVFIHPSRCWVSAWCPCSSQQCGNQEWVKGSVDHKQDTGSNYSMVKLVRQCYFCTLLCLERTSHPVIEKYQIQELVRWLSKQVKAQTNHAWWLKFNSWDPHGENGLLQVVLWPLHAQGSTCVTNKCKRKNWISGCRCSWAWKVREAWHTYPIFRSLRLPNATTDTFGMDPFCSWLGPLWEEYLRDSFLRIPLPVRPHFLSYCSIISILYFFNAAQHDYFRLL